MRRTFRQVLYYTDIIKKLKDTGLVTKASEIEAADKLIHEWIERRSLKGWRVDVNSFLKWMMIRDIREKAADEKEGIRLLTFHSSKGLEFDHVYILDCSDGSIPDERGDPGEQLNVMYVAMTRAKNNLTISYPKEKSIRYHAKSPLFTKEQEPSRYIEWIQQLTLF